MMKKKQPLPEWLNSSLWSSPPDPSDDRLNRCSAISSNFGPDSSKIPSSVSAARYDSPLRHPPVPQPPPPAVRAEPPNSEPAKEIFREDTNGTSTSSSPSSSSSSSSSSPSPALSADEISRQAQLLVELSKKVINIREVRRLASMGIPDGAGIRAAVWKLLLGYLPTDRASWPSELAKKRSQYKHIKDELLMNPSEITRRLEKSGSLENYNSNCESCGLLSRSDVTHKDHPLSLGKSSVWNQFFQDNEIIEQIDRDVKRTHPDMHFFSGTSSFAKSSQDSLRSILIVFAKLNPGIRYVQGMNEILAPLFYVFRNDSDEDNVGYSEADTFFCFVELLSGFRDNFCQQLDNSVVGIRSTITRLSQLLREHDEELWRHLEVACKVNPQFYAFRWITLLLTQEFNFADSLHIWDALLSDVEGPQETLFRVCCAMLILIRRRLLAGDFTSNLKLLQNYPSTNISHLLYVANKLRLHPTT